MLNYKKAAVWQWMKAEERNPNPTFYFNKLQIQKSNYKWHQATPLELDNIIAYLKVVQLQPNFADTKDSLVCKLQSILEQ